MKLLLLVGDSAVGKMTVGQELTRITPMKLFHNHMMIEPVLEIFGERHNRAVTRLRDVIFEEFASSDQYGMIFTFQWAFDSKQDWEYVEHITRIFSNSGAQIYVCELVASQSIRLVRNATENRLAHKPSKRDVDVSTRRLLHDDEAHRCVSFDGEVPFEYYIKLDTEDLSAYDAAAHIAQHFAL